MKHLFFYLLSINYRLSQEGSAGKGRSSRLLMAALQGMRAAFDASGRDRVYPNDLGHAFSVM
jgi:hypothetical protein